MNRAELTATVRSEIGGRTVFYTDAEIHRMLDRVLAMLATYTFCYHTSTTVVVTDALSLLDLPESCLAPLRVSSTLGRLHRWSLRELAARSRTWRADDGPVIAYVPVSAGQIIAWRKALTNASVSLTVQYAALPPALADGNDATVAIGPTDIHPSVAMATAALLRLFKEGGQEGAKPQPKFKSFLDACADLNKSARQQIRTWDAIPPELQPDRLLGVL